MTTDTKPERLPVAGAEPTVLNPATIAAYGAMLELVPDAGEGGMDGILLALAQASDPADLDAPWRTAGLGELVGIALHVTGIRKAPSDYAGGLPFFLIIDGAIKETGETVAVTTGAIGAVAQLLNAMRLGAFPLTVIPRLAGQPQPGRNQPIYLEVVR